MVQASGEGCNESSGRVPTVEDFDGDLAAMGVSGEAEFNAQFGGPVEAVGIVREQDVGDVTTDKSVYAVEHRRLWSFDHVIALVVNADEIELRAIEFDLATLLAKQRHAVLME